MKILFLGDVVGNTGCSKITENLSDEIKKNKIDFVIVNGENADETGVGLTQSICEKFFILFIFYFCCFKVMWIIVYFILSILIVDPS